MIIETNANFNPAAWLETYTRELQTFANCSIGVNLQRAEKIHLEMLSKALIFSIPISQN